MFTRLVCSGGEFKGFAMLGAITVLEEQNIITNIQHFLGCSAGSIICFFLVLGYSSKEILILLKDKLSSNEINNLEIDNIFMFFENYGLDNGDFLRSILIDALHNKYPEYLDIDFISLYKLTNKSLIVSGANVSTQELIYFLHETHPQMSVIEACMISTCVPFIYKPIIYQEHYYCDSGIYNNFPIIYFKEYKKETIGISVKLLENYPINNFSSYLHAIIFSIISKITLLSAGQLSEYHVCEIDVQQKKSFFDFSRLEFVINEEIIDNYYKLGYDVFKSFYLAL